MERTVEGLDLAPLFSTPTLDGVTVTLRNMTFSLMARCPSRSQSGGLGPESACNSVPRVDIPYMGYSVRTDGWRYTAWLPFNGTKNRADWALAPGTEADTAQHGVARQQLPAPGGLGAGPDQGPARLCVDVTPRAVWA